MEQSKLGETDVERIERQLAECWTTSEALLISAEKLHQPQATPEIDPETAEPLAVGARLELRLGRLHQILKTAKEALDGFV